MSQLALAIMTFPEFKRKWGLISICVYQRVGYQCASCMRTHSEEVARVWNDLRLQAGKINNMLTKMLIFLKSIEPRRSDLDDEATIQELIIKTTRRKEHLSEFGKEEWQPIYMYVKDQFYETPHKSKTFIKEDEYSDESSDDLTKDANFELTEEDETEEQQLKLSDDGDSFVSANSCLT